ncbi:hypothetical protein LTR84_004038 [Exophiala bonariae]|uniref:Shikimate dehydrogenase substrate binding N-terminal domain-containing protein n=1 Tax=Exophiala bonariae TaxID=1690606 RepID=A0AAV9N9A3_9EURO|nr:hypothetical protein LTR84_004038 [Exophiala bonariae]
MSVLSQSYSYGTSPFTSTSFSQRLHIHLFGGAQIQHSLSPLINSIFFKHAGASWTYDLCETTDPGRFLDAVYRSDFMGASITMPNKIKFMSSVDVITEEARAIGAVNTVFARLNASGKRIHVGTNTDCIGIHKTLTTCQPDIAQTTKGQPALVVGAGGASRSAIYALWTWLQPSEIYIVNRLKSEVDDLISEMQKSTPGIKLRHIEMVNEARSIPTPQVIIGTVPSEQPRDPGEVLAWDITHAFLSRNASKGTLLDMCYHPLRTRLLDVAEQKGWKILFGSEVLVHIVAAQSTLWLERAPSADAVQEALMAVQSHSTSRSVKSNRL